MQRQAQIDRAGENADSLWDNWTQRATDAVMNYARAKPPGHDFTCEDVRAATANLEEPPHGAWGWVFRSLAKAGRIRKVGFATRENGNPGPVWRRVESEASQ